MRRVWPAAVVALVLAFGAGCGGSGGRAKRPRATAPTTVAPTTASTTTTTTVPILPEQWQRIPDAPVFLGAYNVWTGTEYIGGTAGCCDGLGTTDVVAYSPATRAWRTLAPFPLRVRSEAVAVWTGREMVVAGGLQAASATDISYSHAVPTATGAALDPATNRWRRIAPMPVAITNPDGVAWTGHEVLVLDGSRLLRYDPVADRWSLGATPPHYGTGAVVVWSGTELLVWGGGYELADPPALRVMHADGVAYNPVTDTWRPIPAAPVPARSIAKGVWTGTEMIIWGGDGGGGYRTPDDRGFLGKGAAYNPTTNTWRALPASPLAARDSHVMVWTGREVIVWGGVHRGGRLRDGAAYDPATNTWRKLPPAPSSVVFPEVRGFWTGQWMVLVGGWKTELQATGPSGLAYAPGR